MSTPEESLVVDIESMAYGPHGVARCAAMGDEVAGRRGGGMVVFVRGAVPGERVEVRVRERRRSHVFADVIGVEKASPERRTTPCPIADVCGGCPWQHMSYDAQLRAKRENVVDQLERIAGVDVEVAELHPSPRVFGYRRRLKLRVHDGKIGFYAGGTHDLVEVGHCALAEGDVEAALPAVKRLAESAARNLRRLEIVARNDGDGGIVVVGEVEGTAKPSGSEAEMYRSWLSATSRCTGLILRGKRWVRRWGDPTVHVEVDPVSGRTLTVEAGTFSQVNTTANRLLIECVLGHFGPLAGQCILDAYSGSGNFAAPMAQRGAEVVAVEQSRAACRSGEKNSAALRAPWRVIHGRVATVVDRFVKQGRQFDGLVIDPPRSGAADAVPAILALAPPVLVYVSCNPATMARDLKALRAKFRVTSVQPIDMFPHTYHVENVVRCELL